MLVPGTGIEPVRLFRSTDFKSVVSTNFTTRAIDQASGRTRRPPTRGQTGCAGEGRILARPYDARQHGHRGHRPQEAGRGAETISVFVRATPIRPKKQASIPHRARIMTRPEASSVRTMLTPKPTRVAHMNCRVPSSAEAAPRRPPC